MKNNLVKFVSVSLTSLLIISSCPMRSEVNASVPEPKDFMSSKKREYENPLTIRDLKKSIKKHCQEIFSEKNLPMTLNMLETDSCKLIAPIIWYIHEHSELNIQLPSIKPDLFAKCYAFNVEMYAYNIIEYCQTLDHIKDEITHTKKTIELLKQAKAKLQEDKKQTKLEKIKKQIESKIDEITKVVYEADLSLELSILLNEPHTSLSELIIQLYKDIEHYENSIMRLRMDRLSIPRKPKETSYPRWTVNRKKPSYYFHPFYSCKETSPSN